MIRLPGSLRVWKTPVFKETLKAEIERLDAARLPLQQGLSQGSYAGTDKIGVMILSVSETPESIRAKVGIFYTGMIPGCNCADDPTPVDEHTEYCEVDLAIDKVTAETALTLVQDTTTD